MSSDIVVFVLFDNLKLSIFVQSCNFILLDFLANLFVNKWLDETEIPYQGKKTHSVDR